MILPNYEPHDRPKPILEHLADLRLTLLSAFGAWLAGLLLVLPFAPRLFRILRRPLSAVTDQPDQFLRSLEITGGFSIAMRIVLWGGLIVSAPVIMVLLGRFVFPALRAMERKAVLLGSVFVLLLFALGVGLGYYITLPVALKVMFHLHDWLGIRAEWTAVSYVSFAVKLLLAFGLAFELPALLVALGYLGVVSSAMLRDKRRYAIVIILVLAMLLTPGPDVFSQIIMALPMLLLYEICIWVIRLVERKCGRL